VDKDETSESKHHSEDENACTERQNSKNEKDGSKCHARSKVRIF